MVTALDDMGAWNGQKKRICYVGTELHKGDAARLLQCGVDRSLGIVLCVVILQEICMHQQVVGATRQFRQQSDMVCLRPALR